MIRTARAIGNGMVCLLLMLSASCVVAHSHGGGGHLDGSFNIRHFGAVGDGSHLDSPAINDAIAACSKAGGGTVEVPEGTYLCGSIHMASNINLCLDAGAIIKGAPQEMNVYDPEEIFDGHAYQDEGHTFFHNSLIWGEDLTNVSFTGHGMINGGGLVSQVMGSKGNKSIALKNCKNVLIRDITIFHGGWFAILVTGCDMVTCDNLTIDTNRDGIDIDSCRTSVVSNCRVNSPKDDAIVPKSSYALQYEVPTEDLTITNCQVSGFREGTLLDGSRKPTKNGTGRIKLGTESNGGFRNVTISNCTFDHCRGLCLEEVDGGVLENVTVTNLTMTDIVNCPIFIRLGARNRAPGDIDTGEVKNILISNVIATNIAKNAGILISGLPDYPIRGVRLENIRMTFNGGGTLKDAALVPPELEDGYPEPGRFGKTPSYGLYARHVRDLELSNVHFDYNHKELRPAIACFDVVGFQIDDLQAKVNKGIAPGWFYDVEHFVSRNSPMFEKVPTTQPAATQPATMPSDRPNK
jgi:polygalacturonase